MQRHRKIWYRQEIVNRSKFRDCSDVAVIREITMIKVLKELVKRVENMHEKGGFQQRNVHFEKQNNSRIWYDCEEERVGKLKDRAIESIKAGNQRIKQK